MWHSALMGQSWSLCMQDPSAAEPEPHIKLRGVMRLLNIGRGLPVIAELARTGLLGELLQACSRTARRQGPDLVGA